MLHSIIREVVISMLTGQYEIFCGLNFDLIHGFIPTSIRLVEKYSLSLKMDLNVERILLKVFVL